MTLVATILFWAWSDAMTMIDRYRDARKITMKAYSPDQEVGRAYQPFMRRLVRWSGSFLGRLATRLRNVMEPQLSEYFRLHGYVISAVDGSRFEVPRPANLPGHQCVG